MTQLTVTIVGTGVIGASLGLALKQQKEPLTVIGHDKDLSRAKAAAKLGAFDRADWNLINACEKADLIILAIPLTGLRPTLAAIAADLKPGVVITDTSRSKALPLAWAQELLPAHAHFVGGNPIVQPSGSGYEHAAADLFRGKLYCLTPAPAAHEQAVQLMIGLISLLGAEPFFLDAVEHDSLITATEHLPAVLGVALVNTLAGQNSWREVRKLAGGAFAHLSAGVSGDPDALKDTLLAQREPLLRWLDAYTAQLNDLRALLTAGDDSAAEALAQTIDQAVVAHQNWLTDAREGRLSGPELPAPPPEKPGLLKQMLGMRR